MKVNQNLSPPLGFAGFQHEESEGLHLSLKFVIVVAELEATYLSLEGPSRMYN